MVRCLLVCLFLLFPALVAAEDRLLPLEETVRQRGQLQPGLENYSTSIKTEKIDALLQKFSAGESQSETVPARPVLTWYWQRSKGSLVSARNGQQNDFVQKIVNHFSDLLAAGSENTLIPAGQAELRRQLARKASIKTTDTLLGQTLLKRVELSFAEPIALQEAFYTSDLFLPQKQISSLYFDIDAKAHTIQELGLLTAGGLKLTAEIRYHEVQGGFLPERIKVTSPDGSIDDLLEITYGDVEGFSLPVKIVRTVRHPELKDDFDADFVDYRVNQPFPDSIRTQFELLQ